MKKLLEHTIQSALNKYMIFIITLLFFLLIKWLLPEGNVLSLYPLRVGTTLDYVYALSVAILISQALLLLVRTVTYKQWWRYFGAWYVPLYIFLTLTANRQQIGFSPIPTDPQFSLAIGALILIAVTSMFVLIPHLIFVVKYLWRKRVG